ncbi:MAG: hypothetical protein HOP04_02280 [Methylophilaceae bacterium]|nr:hypothetical protein [Methylophilaceae bacterium]
MQYQMIQTVQHDGKMLNAGEVLDLTERESAPLLASHAIQLVPQDFVGRTFKISLE